MSTRRTAIRGLALAGTSLAGLLALDAVDRRRITADPDTAFLNEPPRGRPLTVRAADGTSLHAEIFGNEDGPTIVFAHGWTCALRFWAYQIRDLAPHARIVAYDQRGHAASGRPPGDDFSVQAFAGDFDAILRATTREGERPVIAGHSLGAMTIAAWAAGQDGGASARVSAAALISTGLSDLVTESTLLPARLSPLRGPVSRVVLTGTRPMPARGTPVTRRSGRYMALGRSASPAVVAFNDALVLACPSQTRGRVGRTLSTIDVLHGLRNLDVPTTVVIGTADRLTPPVHAERMAAGLPQLHELVELPGAGHMTPLEEPERVNAALRSLLASARPAASAAA